MNNLPLIVMLPELNSLQIAILKERIKKEKADLLENLAGFEPWAVDTKAYQAYIRRTAQEVKRNG